MHHLEAGIAHQHDRESDNDAGVMNGKANDGSEHAGTRTGRRDRSAPSQGSVRVP